MERERVKVQDIKPGIIYSLSSSDEDTDIRYMFTCVDIHNSHILYMDNVHGMLTKKSCDVYFVRELTSLEKELD